MNDARNEHSFRYPGWRVALASSGCVFVSFASLLVYTFGVFLKPITAEFGWSRQAASAAFGIAALAVAACSPPLGLLLDRYPARRIILPCLTVFGCAFASLSLLKPPLWLCTPLSWCSEWWETEPLIWPIRARSLPGSATAAAPPLPC